MDAALQTLRDGGPIVGILGLLSLLSLALIVVKLVELAGATGDAGLRDEAMALWIKGERGRARKRLAEAERPPERLLVRAMEGIEAGAGRQALDADLEWRGNAEIARLSRHIRTLELIAMVSPLLGLLGTVLGMIRAFRELALAEGAANAALLAGGIWQALLTTAAGLVVAIPAAIAAGLLAARVDAAGQAIEAAVGRLFALEDGRG